MNKYMKFKKLDQGKNRGERIAVMIWWLTSGKGACCVSADGKEYIDFTAGIGVNCLGFCDDGWVKAVTTQLKKLQHVSNLFYY